MIYALYDLYEVVVGVYAAGFDAPACVFVTVHWVALAAVAMSLDDLGRAVDLGCQRTLL